MAGGSRRPAGGGLLERGGELARIDQAIAALRRGHGGALVIEGAAGIGKSALLQALCERHGSGAADVDNAGVILRSSARSEPKTKSSPASTRSRARSKKIENAAS